MEHRSALIAIIYMFISLCSGVLGFSSSISSPRYQYNAPHSRSSETAHGMFSGIVEEMGTVNSVMKDEKVEMWDGSIGEGFVLSVKTDVAFEDSYIGCSIAVNGVCLTATTIDPETKHITFGLAPETLRKTNLEALAPGATVNLERALRADGRNSGHFVQGHVDGTGEIVSKHTEGDSLWIKVRAPSSLMKYIVSKGFIAIDGTSLTICDVDYASETFTFMLISHTQSCVVIPQKSVGEFVNIEVDVLAKMVESSMGAMEARIAAVEETVRAASAPHRKTGLLRRLGQWLW